MTVCIGCKTCQIACRDRNSLYGVGEIFREVTTNETGAFPNVGYYSLSVSCNHCERPACMGVCPVGAITKREDTGEVILDPEMCIGCKSCVTACPYGEPKFIESEGIAGKCDSCVSLRNKGELTACVAACPMRALDFGVLDDLKEKYGADLISELPILPPASETTPSLLIKPRDNAL
jgi:anaerobic dimethyl sulfoxide reductase subunit B (iron-sulfur subunit)